MDVYCGNASLVTVIVYILNASRVAVKVSTCDKNLRSEF